jgi:hypothetical protein
MYLHRFIRQLHPRLEVHASTTWFLSFPVGWHRTEHVLHSRWFWHQGNASTMGQQRSTKGIRSTIRYRRLERMILIKDLKRWGSNFTTRVEDKCASPFKNSLRRSDLDGVKIFSTARQRLFIETCSSQQQIYNSRHYVTVETGVQIA